MWYKLISDIPIKIKSSIPSAVGLLDASQSPVCSGELLLYLATNRDHLFFYCRGNTLIMWLWMPLNSPVP